MSSLTTAFSPNPINVFFLANKTPYAEAHPGSKARDTARDTSTGAATAAPPKSDSVTISTQARVQALKNSGNSVQQIAISLNLTTAEVDQQLGISTTSASAQAHEVAGLLS